MKIKERVLSKPPAVVEVLRIMAVKAGINDPPGDEWIEKRMGAALEWWEKNMPPSNITESELAETIITKLRSEPKWGWDRVLRGDSH